MKLSCSQAWHRFISQVKSIKSSSYLFMVSFNTVTCYLLTCRIICGLPILYLNLLNIRKAELQLLTLPILYHTNQQPLLVLNLPRAGANHCWRTAADSLSLSLIVRPTVSRPVCPGTKHPSGAYDQIFISLWQLRFCFCRAPSLTRGRVCHVLGSVDSNKSSVRIYKYLHFTCFTLQEYIYNIYKASVSPGQVCCG
jgi:hypothetical protein